METAVNEKETGGAEIVAFEREKKRNEEIERFTAKIESFIARLESRVAHVCDFFAALDPRIEQSYSRLKKQQRLAVKMAELSFAEEEKLEREIAAIISSMSSRQTKTKEALKRDNPSLANSLISKQEFSNTSAQRLAEALQEHRVKNKAIWQRLNKINEIVQRLYINLLLVQILLIQHKDIFEQYKSIAASARLYLKSNMTVNLTAPISPDLSSNIQALEKRTQMALISDAKHEYDKLRKANNIQLRDKISDVLRKLELEGLLLNAQSKKWEKILAQSQHEGKEEIQAISLLKHMRCTEITRIIDLDIEILSVCFTRLQSKFD